MHKLYFLLIALLLSCELQAQTAKVYRGGVLIGTYTSATAAASVATIKGDSIVLSEHTFKEHDIPTFSDQIWKGTMTVSDSTIIDAERLGRVITNIAVARGKSLKFRDIILQNGIGDVGGGIAANADSLILSGHTIIRNCHATKWAGASDIILMFDHSKLIGNSSDSFGGAACGVYAFDSVEIAYNKSPRGGAIGDIGDRGRLMATSPGVRVHHNTATITAGGLTTCGVSRIAHCQFYGNQSPVGPAVTKQCSLEEVKFCRFFNPKPDGKRQYEISITAGMLDITGSWFGQSDTVGLIQKLNLPLAEAYGKHAICKWIVNRSKPVTKADTLFPVDAVFTYVDGTPLPTGSLPWLQGVFTTNKGSFVNPNPIIMPSDTLRGMYRAYTHLPGDTGSRSVSFVCSVDADTFRTTIPVWGKLTASEVFEETEIKIYPNPTSDIVYISGLQRGLELQLEDISGKQLLRRKVQTETEQISLQSYPVGSYMIYILDGAERLGSQRVLKQ
jgi:hypothetical protein